MFLACPAWGTLMISSHSQVNPGSLQSAHSFPVLTAIYFSSHILLLPSYYFKLQLYQTLWSLGFCLCCFPCLESPYFYHVLYVVSLSPSSFQPSSRPAFPWGFLSSSSRHVRARGVWPLYTDSEYTTPFSLGFDLDLRPGSVLYWVTSGKRKRANIY